MHLDDRGRKNSDPIPIPITSSSARRSQDGHTPVGTPLTARGDLPWLVHVLHEIVKAAANRHSGYFPTYEQVLPVYKAHPFSASPRLESESGFSSSTSLSPKAKAKPKAKSKAKPTMSRKLPPSEPVTRRGTPHNYNSSPKLVETVIPMARGKYYPSNYIPPACVASSPSSPSHKSFASSHRSPTSTHLALPAAGHRKSKDNTHQCQNSDIKRKVREYQRDMIAEARKAASSARHTQTSVSFPTTCAAVCKPLLRPISSPGIVITPFELEESAGYVLAGERRGSATGALGDGAQRQAVQRMIEAEEQRRRRDRTGLASPMGSV